MRDSSFFSKRVRQEEGLFLPLDFSRSLKRRKRSQNTENEEQDTSLREALHSSSDLVKRTTVEDVKMSRNLPYIGKLQL